MSLPETVTSARTGAEHRADHEALHGRYNQKFSPAEYGAVEDGIADDTAAINDAITAAAAASSGCVVLGRRHKVTSINLAENVPVLGDSQRGTLVTGTAGSDIFVVPTAGGNSFFYLANLGTSGGRRALRYSAGATADWCSYLRLENVEFSGPSAECVYTEGQIEEWYFDNVRLIGGTYGFRHANVGADSGACVVDKCTFKDVLTAGQTEQGWRVEALTGGTNTWINPIANNVQKEGFYFDGGFVSLVFINVNTEGNGQAGKKNRTTGSITSGTPTLVVALATGYAIGDTVTVKGAGQYGFDLTSVATNVVGTTVTLTDNAQTTVTAVEVTNALYDDIRFASSISSTQHVSFIGGVIGQEADGGKLRYAANLSGALFTSLIALRAAPGIPVYDPSVSAMVLGSYVDYRATDLFTGVGGSQLVITPDVAPSTSIPSPKGKSLILWLRDSLGDSTGTYGSFSWRRYDANRTQLLSLDGTTFQLSLAGSIALGNPAGWSYGKRIFQDAAAPTSGAFVQGDIVFNEGPVAGGTVGWVCTTGGTPGTWKTFGAIAA